jgi:hypothetical protein
MRFDGKNKLFSAEFIQNKILVMYGCETWSFTLREECRLTAFRIGC